MRAWMIASELGVTSKPATLLQVLSDTKVIPSYFLLYVTLDALKICNRVADLPCDSLLICCHSRPHCSPACSLIPTRDESTSSSPK